MRSSVTGGVLLSLCLSDVILMIKLKERNEDSVGSRGWIGHLSWGAAVAFGNNTDSSFCFTSGDAL